MMNREIRNKVDGLITKHGKEEDKVIPLLQAVQNEFNYLPEDVMEYICRHTDITPARIYGVSTFYTQFRHRPVGKHIIKVCVGTACHVKGAMQVYDAYKRELAISDPNEDTDAEGLFTVEKVACLGCCTIAPVVQIDDITYGKLTTEKVAETLKDFINNKDKAQQDYTGIGTKINNVQGEIRLGLGSCCVASGSALVQQELNQVLEKNKISVDIKQVGCVGICNQVPMLEIQKPGEQTVFYTKIKAEEVSGVINKHFKPVSFINRLKSNVFNFFEDVVFKEAKKRGVHINTIILPK